MTTTTHPSKAALKMAQATEVCRWHEGSRLTLYFAADGRRLVPGGRKVVSSNGGVTSDWHPETFAFAIEYPFAPSVASLADMVAEFEEHEKPVRYDEERWEEDPRITEQAGPSLAEDWHLVELMEKRVAV